MRKKHSSPTDTTQTTQTGAKNPTAGTDADTTAAETNKRFYRSELEHAGIFRRFQDITFKSIEAYGLPENPNIRKNYDRVKEYAANLREEIKQGKGLVFAGDYGTMKTTMAVAILRAWMEMGGHGLIIPMCSLIDNLFTMQGSVRAQYEEHIRNIPLLVLDDLGGENSDQGWVLAKIDSIFTERYNKMLATIVTTNLTQSGLEETYTRRIFDRLRSTSYYLRFTGESERPTLRRAQILPFNSLGSNDGKES